MLDSVDPKVRLSKATELVDRHLQVISSSSDKHLMLLHEMFLIIPPAFKKSCFNVYL
jgi:hypothetical protein